MSELLDPSWGESTSSAAGSRARTSPLPARALASLVLEAAFGQSTRDSLASFDRATSSWRTSQGFLASDLIESSLTLPLMGTVRSGFLCPLPTWEGHISENGFSSLPTLTKSDAHLHTRGVKPSDLYTDRNGGPRKRTRGGRSATLMLAQRCVLGHLPTLTKNDYKTRRKSASWNGNDLVSTVGQLLTPPYCEAFMGFPSGWTALELSATPSPRRSRKSSGG